MLDYQYLTHSLIVAAVMFSLGIVGFITRRNLVTVVISAGIMLQACVLALTAFSRFHANDSGRVFSVLTIVAIFVIGVLGLSLAIALSRQFGFIDLSRWKPSDQEPACEPSSTAQIHSAEQGSRTEGAGN